MSLFHDYYYDASIDNEEFHRGKICYVITTPLPVIEQIVEIPFRRLSRKYASRVARCTCGTFAKVSTATAERVPPPYSAGAHIEASALPSRVARALIARRPLIKRQSGQTPSAGECRYAIYLYSYLSSLTRGLVRETLFLSSVCLSSRTSLIANSGAALSCASPFPLPHPSRPDR